MLIALGILCLCTYIMVYVYKYKYSENDAFSFNAGLTLAFFHLILFVDKSIDIMSYDSVYNILFQLCGIVGIISFGIRIQLYDYESAQNSASPKSSPSQSHPK